MVASIQSVAFPDAFRPLLKDAVGDDFAAVESALCDKPIASLRVNPARLGVRALLDGVIGAQVAWEPKGYYLPDGWKPGRDIAHFAGGYYMQEASAMASARVLDAQPGERVLDLCAAPGGKSGQIAAALHGTGVLIANEPDAARARVLASNLERLGASCAVVTQALPRQLADACPNAFDAVLVDAPCSGEGMFRRDPAAVGEWSVARARGCAARQREILTQAARLVRPGGRLVYSTCTFNRMENEENAQWFLDAFPMFTPMRFALPGVGASRDGCLRLLPGKILGEGHFVAAFRRADDTDAPKRDCAANTAPRPDAWRALCETLPGDWPELFADMRVHLCDALLVATPACAPSLTNVRVLARGTALCELGRSHVKPAHALAMAAAPGAIANTVALDDAQARAYLSGAALPCAVRGWALATWNNLPLGFGKGADGIFKNHLPKGLRQST